MTTENTTKFARTNSQAPSAGRAAAAAGGGSCGGRGAGVSLSQAARRTGLADSGATMARVCAVREVPTFGTGADPVVSGIVTGVVSGVVTAPVGVARSYVTLSAFTGAAAEIALGEVVVVDRGHL